MSAPKAEFLFDFGSPNVFLAGLVLPEIEKRTGVKFVHIPVLLGGIFKATGNRAPWEAFAHIPSKIDYDRRDLERFIDRHAIQGFNDNPFFPVNTLVLMRGAVAAEKIGVFDEYVRTIFHHMWREPRKLDDLEILVATLKEAGLPVDALVQGVQDPEVKQKLIQNTEYAVSRGAFGAPTFIVNDEIWFGKERLHDVEQAILAAS